MAPRQASVLILIVGIIAMLAVMATGFLVRMRQDAGQADDVLRLAQNRIMLHAAMSYIQEASRLGYAVMTGDGRCSAPREAWGWLDTRVIVPNGGSRIGPNDATGRPLSTSGQWPSVGSVMRAPMQCMKRPPFSVRQLNTPNAIPTEMGKPTFGIPFLNRCDPLPLLPTEAPFDESSPNPSAMISVTDPVTGRTVSKAARQWWSDGDRTVLPETANLAWFRIRREDGSESTGDPALGRRPINAGPIGATFVITVGSGGTQGFRDWAEVQAAGATARFGDRNLFDDLKSIELRQWYRVEWSPAVGGGEDIAFTPANEEITPASVNRLSWYQTGPLNASRVTNDPFANTSRAAPRNYVGTIRYIQRLPIPPAGDKW